MKAWILHHHLLTGGVTSVIHTQCKAYRDCGLNFEVVVGDDAGLRPGDQDPRVLSALNYLPRGLKKQDLDEIRRELYEGLKPLSKEGILHVHNLNLGKNPLLNLVIHQLLQEGARVLNHCHDFAEDQRPLNMEHLHKVLHETYDQDVESILYPSDGELSYAVINTADRELLRSHGVDEAQILDCPNAIAPPKPVPSGARARTLSQLSLPDIPLVLYPVRAIERKNIPEILLLSALWNGKACFAITQPPKNPAEVELYQPWVDFAQDLKLPVIFEAGLKANFGDLMAGCSMVISTSLNEGFGLGFLEPWLFGKAVIGRDLPQVTQDFKAKGILFPKLYSQLEVNGKDFPTHSDDQKRAIIETVLQEPSIAKSISSQNQLQSFLDEIEPSLIQDNEKQILDHYSVKRYGERLSDFYATSFR